MEARYSLTHGGDNLSFHPELVLESSCKVRYPAFAVSCDVWHLSDVVEHVPASKEQNGDDAETGPKVTVL